MVVSTNEPLMETIIDYFGRKRTPKATHTRTMR